MDDPALFGRWFLGSSWDAWRCVLKGAFALPMSAGERKLFRTLADRAPPRRRVKELWVVAGRRAGKDSVASLIATHAAVFSDYSGRLRPGERPTTMCLAVDRTQAKIAFGYIRGYFDEVPMLRALVTRWGSEALELASGATISVHTNSYRNVRGRTLACVILDEVSYWRDEDSATPDVETYNAVLPGLVTLPDTMLIGITTAYKKSGLAYQKWQQHFGQRDDDILVVRGPSRSFNPTLPQSVVDTALARDREAAAAEYLSEWRSDLSDFLDRELIGAAVDSALVRPPQERFQYVAFADPSGGRGDAFTASVAHAENDAVVLDCVFEKRAPFDPRSVVRDEIAPLLRSYRVAEVTGDKYSAEWVVGAFRDEQITYRQSDRDRSAIYVNALPLFTSGRARILQNERLIAQLVGLERKTGPSGRDRVDHGPHGSDDVSNSACGALVLAAKPPVKQKNFAGLIPFVVSGPIPDKFSSNPFEVSTRGSW